MSGGTEGQRGVNRIFPLVVFVLVGVVLLHVMRLKPIATVSDVIGAELNRGSSYKEAQRPLLHHSNSTLAVYDGPEIGMPVQSAYIWDNYRYDPSRIMIIQFSDAQYARMFSPQLRSVACYAKQHGYRHEVVDPNKLGDCRRMKNDFFHKQLCALHHIMKNSPEIEYFIKVDGDVVAGTSDMSLKHWIEDGADMVVFERYLTGEFNAGFYALRNTAAARQLVWNWSEFWWRGNLSTGYNGADNGSIHLAILDALQVTGREECWDIYRSGLNGSLASYFEYVACCRMLLGPARRHHHASPHNINGSVSITTWPAVFGPMIDSLMIGEVLHVRNLYPIHHGIKSLTDPVITEAYGQPEHLGDVEFHDGHCTHWNPKRQGEDVWPRVWKKALQYSKPQEEEEDYHGLPTQCFASPGPSCHWRAPRYSMEGFDAGCQKGLEFCQPLGPADTFTHEGYRCTGKHNDNEEETQMTLTRLSNPLPSYDEVILEELAVQWNREVDEEPKDQKTKEVKNKENA